MATAKRRPWNEMDHDHDLLREEIVYASRTELRGPIPEFLAKKHAERAPGTAAGYEVAFGVFERFCKESGIETVGQIVEGVAHDFWGTLPADRTGSRRTRRNYGLSNPSFALWSNSGCTGCRRVNASTGVRIVQE